MYFAYGFPKSYRILAGDDPSEEVVYASFNGSDNLVVVTSTTIQLWSGGQQKMKLGELVRDEESIEDEGRNIRAWWCPSRRVIAVATHLGYILFFGLHPTKEIIWKSPEGLEARKIIIYLQNSAYLRDLTTNTAGNDSEQEVDLILDNDVGSSGRGSLTIIDRIADLCGDAKSLGVVLESGAILAFSWAAKLRCSASPLLPSSQTPNGRSSRNRLRRGFTSSTGKDEDLATATANNSEDLSSSTTPWLANAYNNDDILPLPTPIDSQDAPITVRSVSYVPSVRLMTVTLHDGRVALLSLPAGGLAEIETARCVRWIYKPKSYAVRAVSAAVQPSGHYIAVGLAHGRVAIYSMTRILTPVNATGGKYHTRRNTQALHHTSSIDSPRITSVPENGGSGSRGGSAGTAGQPEPDHILSLTEWGYSSSLLGPAHVVRWSPDGKVVAAGYGYRGLAVWTPSGCRVMCTLRQAAQGMVVGSSTAPESTFLDENHHQNRQHQLQQQQQQGFSESAEISLATIDTASDFESGIGSPSGLNPHHGNPLNTGNTGTTTTATGGSVSGTSTPAGTGILEGGIAALAWSQHGYSLMVVELPSPSPSAAAAAAALIGSSSPVAVVGEQIGIQQQQQQLLEISFARAVHSGHRVAEARPLGPSAAGGGASEQGGGAVAANAGQQQQASSPEEAFVLQAADRVLLVLETTPSSVAAVHAGLLDATEAEAVLHWQPDLTLQHVRLPQQYLDSAFPILHVAVSQGSRDIAVAGTRGLAVLNVKTRKWRLFGDAMQERRVKAHALTWLPRGVVAAIASVDDTATSTSGSSGSASGVKLTSSLSYSSGATLATATGGGVGSVGGGVSSSASSAPTLLLFPRDHLDFSSLIARYPLPQLPAAIDAIGPFLALAYAPLEISLLRVDYLDQLEKPRGTGINASKSPKAKLTPIRELNILGLGGPLQELTLLPPPLLPTTEEEEENEDQSNTISTTGVWLKKSGSSNTIAISEDGPSHCVLLRGGGILSVLDLHQGTESVLSDQIESYWLPQSSGSKPVLPSPTPLSAVGRDDSAAAMPIDEAKSPAAKGAAWLERRTSDVAAAAAAISGDEMAAMAAAAASMGIGGGSGSGSGSGGGLASRSGSTALLLGGGVEEEHPPVEMPWWTYGARGMQLWFPSSLFDPSWGRSNFGNNHHHYSSTNNSASTSTNTPDRSGSAASGGMMAASARGGANATDPELEFDKEVYPLGISLAEVSIVGMMQRTARTSTFPAKSPPAFSLHPHPESQPVLPCLLRRLLEQGRAADALELATRHSRGPHFARSLEWLLFTTLEADADAPKDVVARRVRFASPKAIVAEEKVHVFEPTRGASPVGGRGVVAKKAAIRGVAGPLLISAARLVQQFPQSAEIVVSVARKTDAQLWPALFAAAGSPSALCQGLLANGALQTAACCLLIVDRVEGPGKAHGLALRLVRSALSASSYGLAADLLRFLMPPGENELAELVGPNTTHSTEQQQHQKTDVVIKAQEKQQQEQNTTVNSTSSGGTGGTVSWLWSYFTGADRLPADTPTAAPTTNTPSAGPKTTSNTWNAPSSQKDPSQEEDSVTRRLHRAASAGSLNGDGSGDDGGVAELGAAVSAWKVMGRHAWKLLDIGALRELASFGAAMANLHGGLPALLSTAAGEVPLSLSHTTPSAAAIASALFVASNEFAAAAESDFDAAAAAESLELACAASGCVNHAMALSLMLGDTVAVEAFSAEHPRVWSLLTELIANDVHLCAFSGLLAPPSTPLMVAPAGG